MEYSHFSPKNHIGKLVSDPYYRNLILLRNTIETACDNFFAGWQAPRVDLYMISKSVSSPMGKGSDSEPIPIMLRGHSVHLVDSAQFGMEPLVLKAFPMVYCYLPSFRGESADARHLNQFYHCEAELRGTLTDCQNVVVGLVRAIIQSVCRAAQVGKFRFDGIDFDNLLAYIEQPFPSIMLDEAIELLKKTNHEDLIEYRSCGRTLSRQAETILSSLVTNDKAPLWITHFDVDTVPFYQKPDPSNPNKAINADLIFPPIAGGFGGEVVGSGQRQDKADEIVAAMDRQEIADQTAYRWYCELRNSPDYTTTSGFGLGVERFVAWMLALNNIADAAPYPVTLAEEITY